MPIAVRASTFITLAASLVLAACVQSAPSTVDAAAGSEDTAIGPDEMLAQLPDRFSAKCLGRIEFIDAREIIGRSSCEAGFAGKADQSLKAGTICVFSGTPRERTSTEITATGYFACSDGTRGTLLFKERPGNGPGTAVATTDDGRIVIFDYD